MVCFTLYSLKLYREEVLNTHLVTSFGRSLSWGQLNYYRLCMHEEKSWKNILNNECMRKTETLKEKDILTKESKYSLSTNFQWNGKTHFTGWCVTLWGNGMNNNNTHCMSSFCVFKRTWKTIELDLFGTKIFFVRKMRGD